MGKFQFKSLFGRGRAATEEAQKDRRRNIRTTPPKGSSILVVDDSRTVRTMLCRMLESGGFQTLQAEDGETAIKKATEFKPTLIIMDVVMPGITGFQATRQLRKIPETKEIPIVIMSGNEQATEEFWVIRIGANDFMGKPFSRFEVYRRIEKILYSNEII
ncbi:MAG: response regulator [bacterium]